MACVYVSHNLVDVENTESLWKINERRQTDMAWHESKTFITTMKTPYKILNAKCYYGAL